MRWIFGSLILAASCWLWSSVADEIALLAWGSQARAYVKHVSSSTHRRGTSYTAFYEFTTEDKRLGNGSCPTHKNAQGASLWVLYLKARPNVNRPDKNWYGLLMMSAYGAGGFLLCLWSARIFMRRPKRLGGYPEEGGALQPSQSAEALREAPGQPHWRNRWGLTFLLALGLSGGLILVSVAAVSDPAAPLWKMLGGESAEPGPAEGESTSAASPVVPAQALPADHFGATPGNAANQCLLGFDEDWLYLSIWRDYNNTNAPAPGLYRQQLSDGSGLAPVGKLSDTEALFQGINVRDGWIYYVRMQGIARIRTDGSKHQLLSKNDVSSMIVAGDWIYHQVKWDHDRVWRMKLNGGGAVSLMDEEVGAVCVAGDGRIYYVNKTDGGSVYSRNHDGSARRKISERKARLLLAQGDTLWFIDGESSQLCRMGTDGSSPETIVEDKVGSLNISGDRLYFSRSGGISRCRFDGSEMEPVVSNAEVWQFFLHKGRVYYRSGEEKPILSVAEDGSDPRKF